MKRTVKTKVSDKVAQVADGKKFKFLSEKAIQTKELKFFKFDSPKQKIITETKEFSAVCPFSGLPDVAHLTIEYFPIGGRCIELKALKYYLTSFRLVGIYQEAVTKRIYNDLAKILALKDPTCGRIGHVLKVTTVYNTRGGFDTTCIEGSI